MTAPRVPLTALLLFAALAPARGAEPNAELRPAKDGVPAAVVVTGIEKPHLTALAAAKLTADEWPRVARLVVDEGTPEEVTKKQGVAGAWAVTDDGLRFEPLFPLVPGTKYRLFVTPGAAPRVKIAAAPFALAVLLPKPPPGPRVGVAGVFPSANRLPENTLRFYVQFSGPVSRAATYSHIKLTRDDGRQVLTPFLEIDEQLWSPDGTRLTLLFDPGRVKRGLKPREEDGPILEEGRRYTFEIDAAWEDLDGRPLTAKFTKAFSVSAPDDEPVWPEDWALMPPRAGSDAPLIIRLAKPLDRALLARLLSVRDASGKTVEGTVTVGGGERVVTFAPARAWGKGDYKLVVDARLEDVCGNRVGEPFELDVLKPIPERAVAKVAERPFAVK
ncbi:hypothetical protein GobsT_16210 [Gemmata obscuriglobus]|uniref:SbsA Ig-like domain-containing protein n=1 Tax=Gemmata obscuriglobus TaxID=114 RepID=A0A2Z3HF78_9BACT|nr:hypothetical protein [Gemmata obscuriglobus]AWM39980.1 hypothetical protein C1280_25220 [Gemmata obscuriglobus]QEG26873.1 hypothetical protein GobsT_16210 [Gemmata obscuriglobus]VTS02910.1 Uncharacterized protein OS=Singulisphaera acidiphila (strain ATCC BAA-1392 / DSM 18658 / VKM B-2454 / MOB10) GN=Sinac_5380 PE=4 SV=1 [Gemmata obscuriglobus UQM 2246]